MVNTERAENFIQEVEKIVERNYPYIELAEDRSLGATSVGTPSNSIIARVYLQPNKYNRHIDDEKVRKQVEEIASIAAGREATSLTDMRQSRQQSSRDFYSNYPDGLKIIETGGTERRGYPIFEIELKYLNRDA